MCLPCTCKAQMPAGAEGETQLTQVVLKGLGDKLYDKRKAAALEVEQLIKNLSKEVTHKFASQDTLIAELMQTRPPLLYSES